MKNNIRDILDETNISIVDELNILEYIDELEQVKEKNDKAIEYIENFDSLCKQDEELLDKLRGEDNDI